jgi:hypothetical protein
MSNNDYRFTIADLQKWVEKGLISPEQGMNIRSYIESSGSVEEQNLGMPEKRNGLNFISLAYYFGSFMILLAYTIFMGLEWETMGYPLQIAVSFGTIAVLWLIGFFLRSKGFGVAGGLLIFAGTGIVPLLITTVQRAVGLWPDTEFAYRDFYRIVARTWVPLEVISILVTLIMIWRVRFPLLTLLIAFWMWFLSMDLTRWFTQSDSWSWTDVEQTVSAIMGAGMLLLGVFLQRRAKQDYSSWFYLFGHLIILSFFSSLTFDREGILGLVYFAVYLSFVVASVWLQRRVFLVFGAIGCYSYLSYLAFQVFDGEMGFVFALGGIGLLIVLSAVGFQKYARPWLEKQFVPRRLGDQISPS